MKKDLQAASKISWTTTTKMSKNEKVNMDMLMKICETLHCNIGDIMDILPDEDLGTPEVAK